MMNNQDDPWRLIPTPDQEGLITGHRADADLRWHFFWAVDSERRCLLVLRHERKNQTAQKLPRLRGIEVELRIQESDDSSSLILRLLDPDQRELFYRLCLDIVTATKQAESEQEAVGLFLTRTWRWHRLLKVGRSGLLSEEEQKGLIGELQVLQDVIFPEIGIASGIRAWKGPLDAPKDFEIEGNCIECKTRLGASTPYIEIASEHQLDCEGVQSLFVHVLDVATATEDTVGGVTLTEVVASIVEVVRSKEPASLEILEEKLLATGFEFEHNYSDWKWAIGQARAFEVRNGFPRLSSTDIPSGVHKVRYRIALSDCKPYELSLEVLQHHFRRSNE